MVKKISHSREKSSTVAKTFLIKNELGLHARAAAQFVKIAGHFASEILVAKDSREINGKSIMGLLMLAAARGSKISVKASGPDAEEALNALGKLIENKFGEN